MTVKPPAAANIALVLHDFAGGGTERIAIRLANRWVATGRKVTILCGAEIGPARTEVDPKVDVQVMRPPIPRGILSRVRFGLALAAALPSIAPDVLVGPGNFHVPVLWTTQLRMRRCPPVICKLSNPIRRPRRGRFRQAIFTGFLRLATRRFTLVAMSPSLAWEARTTIGRKGVTSIADPNVPDDWAPPSRSSRTGVIVCAGRLTPQKNFVLALRTFAALGPGWRLDILGDGEDRAMIEAAAIGLGVAGQVRFLGYVPDIAPYLLEADALLCTSHYEGGPAVVIEALAAGTPVVSTNCSPALRQMLGHPSFGRIAETDPLALAAALRSVTEAGWPDPGALARHLSDYRTGRSASSWLSVLDQAAAGAD